MSRAVLEQCEGLPTRRYLMGESLIWPSRPTRELLVLKSGCVEILKGSTRLGQEGEPGSIFGEVSAILGDSPMATVRAVVETECYLIEDLESFLESREVALELVRVMARRLKKAGDEIRAYS